MPKGLPQAVRENLDKSRQAAIAAVDTYNRPGPRFRTAQFLILIVIAWTALLHSIFYKRGIKPWYKVKAKGGLQTRYAKIDGDPKHWDLAECLKEFYGEQTTPQRSNLAFLLGLRNKIEHRHLPHLDSTLFGECQASLINFEELLVDTFGHKYALTEELALAMQFSQLMPESKARAIKSSVKAAAAPVVKYIEGFRGALPSPVLESMNYSFSVYLVPRVSNRAKSADAAITFVHVDEASPEELEKLHRLNVLIREKHIPISNHDKCKPSEVVSRVAARIPHDFQMHHHTMCWRHFQVRPAKGVGRKDKTDARYCVYDAPHDDYLYTAAWIEKLVAALSDPTPFEEITGQTARAS